MCSAIGMGVMATGECSITQNLQRRHIEGASSCIAGKKSKPMKRRDFSPVACCDLVAVAARAGTLQ